MNILDILIIIIVVALVLIMVNSRQMNNFNLFKNIRNLGKLRGLNNDISDINDNINHDISDDMNYEHYSVDSVHKVKNNLYEFNDSKLNNDYKEVNAAIIKMTKGKEKFNMAEKPIKITKPSKKKILNLVKQFVKELSDTALQTGTVSDISNGWLNALPLNKEVDGWEKQMKKLGLPTSIYTKSAIPSVIKLVKISKYYSHETDDDMRIVCEIICQKKSSKDRIILEIYFWIDKRNVNDDRTLFKDKVNNAFDSLSIESNNSEGSELPIIIEKIDILGFMIRDNSGSEENTARKQFYNFKGLRNKDGIIDQQKLMEQVMARRMARARETNTRIDDAELRQMDEQNEILNRETLVDNIDLIFDE
jgi:hypothetical protein